MKLNSELESATMQSSKVNIQPGIDAPKNRFEIDRSLFPFESRFVSLKSGARIHYIDEGEGPVLLFLHGNPTWSFLYRNIIKNLRNDFRCIALDYPGYGLSTAPTDKNFSPDEHSAVVAEFVERLELENITIMVQDWGGPIGFDFALKHPDRVKGFVIGNTFAWPLERVGQKIFSAIMGGIIGRYITWAFNGVTRFFMRRGVVTPLEDAAFAMYLAPFQSRDRRAPTHIAPLQLVEARSFLSNIDQNLSAISEKPALIIWGLEDFAFQKPERTRFEKVFPLHKTVLLEKAGHFLQEDKPDEISAEIRNWYSGVK